MDIEANKTKTNSLQAEIQQLKAGKSDLESQLDTQEQYTRRNCLLLHGVPEIKGDDTTTESLKKINTQLNPNIRDFAFMCLNERNISQASSQFAQLFSLAKN